MHVRRTSQHNGCPPGSRPERTSLRMGHYRRTAPDARTMARRSSPACHGPAPGHVARVCRPGCPAARLPGGPKAGTCRPRRCQRADGTGWVGCGSRSRLPRAVDHHGGRRRDDGGIAAPAPGPGGGAAFVRRSILTGLANSIANGLSNSGVTSSAGGCDIHGHCWTRTWCSSVAAQGFVSSACVVLSFAAAGPGNVLLLRQLVRRHDDRHLSAVTRRHPPAEGSVGPWQLLRVVVPGHAGGAAATVGRCTLRA